ncbi:thiamine biosynthesis protein ThiJ [Ureibacillus massiliensis 4400831 = CIP 108448 = CCUG 49529]|uniref:Thiamine biosynthesis protein ThiJ n=1 Tax=Ureibacillus massiliensis 4400831 = CIP 108448 = CCUG 49529 TaxID=1211035 RepID=A0A0A3J9P5_9BACL|nr:DJ-1/PfpI family protein [Ureibacillus massiliensis]KGR91888.1 thiamine biosynthesis protein ThiJ [Ureibacillus massiliensis 4400831 = CIP 108448 = CCUG 49529]
MHIQIVLFDGFDLLDAIAPYEVFNAAAMYSNEDITVKLVSAEGERMVTSGVNHLQIQANGKLDLTSNGIILIPGASGSVHDNGPDSVPVRLRQAAETELGNLLNEAMQKQAILLSTVCGGSLILAMGGLLEGRHAVTHHMGMGLLGATNAIPVNARIVDDGNLVTGGGVTSGLDVALYLVERELGPRIAHAVEQLFEYERRGTVWKAEGNSPKENQEETQAEETSHQSSQTNKTEDFQGEWDTTISTPIGKLSVLINLTNIDGQIIGTAKQGGDIVTLDNLIIEGNQLKWSMKVSKPMRLNLKFNVSINGNNMIGEAKAGMLPASKLVGHRIL